MDQYKQTGSNLTNQSFRPWWPVKSNTGMRYKPMRYRYNFLPWFHTCYFEDSKLGLGIINGLSQGSQIILFLLVSMPRENQYFVVLWKQSLCPWSPVKINIGTELQGYKTYFLPWFCLRVGEELYVGSKPSLKIIPMKIYEEVSYESK